MFTVRYTAVISRNHISLTDTSTGETIARAASNPFSSKHRLVADEEEAASFAGNLIRQIAGRRRWRILLPTIDVAIVGDPGEARDVDDVRRLFHNQGFVRVRVK